MALRERGRAGRPGVVLPAGGDTRAHVVRRGADAIRRSRWRCPRRCGGRASRSSGRPRCSRSWRPSGSWTPTSSTATAAVPPACGPESLSQPTSGVVVAVRGKTGCHHRPGHDDGGPARDRVRRERRARTALRQGAPQPPPGPPAVPDPPRRDRRLRGDRRRRAGLVAGDRAGQLEVLPRHPRCWPPPGRSARSRPGPLYLGRISTPRRGRPAPAGRRRDPARPGAGRCVRASARSWCTRSRSWTDRSASVLAHASAGVTPLLVLITVVNGIAEELFFRGALYAAIPRHPVIVSTLAYTIATLATGNLMLGFAAVLLGLVVGLERRASGGVLAPILTHVTWSTTMLFAAAADLLSRTGPYAGIGPERGTRHARPEVPVERFAHWSCGTGASSSPSGWCSSSPAGVAAGRLSDRLTFDFSLPGQPGDTAEKALMTDFGVSSADTLVPVLTMPEGERSPSTSPTSAGSSGPCATQVGGADARPGRRLRLAPGTSGSSPPTARRPSGWCRGRRPRASGPGLEQELLPTLEQAAGPSGIEVALTSYALLVGRRGLRGPQRARGDADRGDRCAGGAAVRLRVVPGVRAAADRGGVDPDHVPDRAGADHVLRRELRRAVPDLADRPRGGDRLLAAAGLALAGGARARPRQRGGRGDRDAHGRPRGAGLRRDRRDQPARAGRRCRCRSCAAWASAAC